MKLHYGEASLYFDHHKDASDVSEVPAIQGRAQAQGSIAIFRSRKRLKNVAKQKPWFLLCGSE
jgi:hypothetical protein